MEAIDSHLDEIQTKLRNNIQFYLTVNTDRAFWEREDKFRYRNGRELNDRILDAFQSVYDEYDEVVDNIVCTLQNCAWVGMNVSYPRDPDAHIDRIVDNIMEVYITSGYSELRAEMLSKILNY